jgi:transposase
MLKVFKYKLQPNHKQSLALQRTLDVCRDVFNLSLEQTRKKKSLSERTHECSECGLVLHRDTAAAQVILGRMCPLDAKIGELIPCLV